MTNGGAAFEWDPAKAERNLASHGVSFEAVVDFDFRMAFIVRDERRDYGEDRFIALGLIRGCVHALVYTKRAAHIRVISLRKANPREVQIYDGSFQSEGPDR